ncbi:hypothetical protein EV424DRAFT_1343643 [Suillus variegatus]|nr:hypothetical protein EV424DRAFT_1343643 [Suillus variegatus]
MSLVILHLGQRSSGLKLEFPVRQLIPIRADTHRFAYSELQRLPCITFPVSIGSQTVKICCKTLYDSNVITKIYKLVNGEEQIDIIVTHWDCAIAPILQFHSTVVMSYIKADSILIMYPEWVYDRKPESFVHSRLYMEGKTNTRTIEALYTERGFKLYAEPFKL